MLDTNEIDNMTNEKPKIKVKEEQIVIDIRALVCYYIKKPYMSDSSVNREIRECIAGF